MDQQEEQGQGQSEQQPGADALAALIEQYQLTPGVVRELIGGSTVEEVKASLVKAKAAFEAAVAEVKAQAARQVPGAHGNGAPAAPPTTAHEMIVAGVAAHQARRRS